jgi:hypothetical protein
MKRHFHGMAVALVLLPAAAFAQPPSAAIAASDSGYKSALNGYVRPEAPKTSPDREWLAANRALRDDAGPETGGMQMGDMQMSAKPMDSNPMGGMSKGDMPSAAHRHPMKGMAMKGMSAPKTAASAAAASSAGTPMKKMGH